jgi:hypothetical protein
MSRLTNIDFSQFDPDEPLPELFTNRHQSLLAKWIGKVPCEAVFDGLVPELQRRGLTRKACAHKHF